MISIIAIWIPEPRRPRNIVHAAMYKMMTKMFMMTMMMKKKMTAVSRNLAINFVSSKLGPFIRGHDLPNSPIVNDDDLNVLGDKESFFAMG